MRSGGESEAELELEGVHIERGRQRGPGDLAGMRPLQKARSGITVRAEAGDALTNKAS